MTIFFLNICVAYVSLVRSSKTIKMVLRPCNLEIYLQNIKPTKAIFLLKSHVPHVTSPQPIPAKLIAIYNSSIIYLTNFQGKQSSLICLHKYVGNGWVTDKLKKIPISYYCHKNGLEWKFICCYLIVFIGRESPIKFFYAQLLAYVRYYKI